MTVCGDLIKKACFFDRDGVLIEAIVRDGRPFSIRDPSQIEYVSGLLPLTKFLKKQGVLTFCITNQPDISRGRVSEQAMIEVNSLVKEYFDLDAVLMCPHDEIDNCSCRKPKVGLVEKFCGDYGVDRSSSSVIGDRWSDIACGNAAGLGLAVFWNKGYFADKSPDQPFEEVLNLSELCAITRKFYEQ